MGEGESRGVDAASGGQVLLLRLEYQIIIKGAQLCG